MRHPVVDAGLARLGARVTGRHDADEEPPAGPLEHEGAPRVALAAVPAAGLVAGAHHLVEDGHRDALGAVPAFALPAEGGEMWG